MRKILAILCTLITLYALKETIFIFTTHDPEILAKKTQLILVAISITLPLVILSLWLWRPKNNNPENPS